VLNRIYIIIGVLAIIALAGAFIAPRFIQWGDYRDRMEALATEALGEDVTIRGDIEFSLLPQPRLSFTDVVVGSIEAPAATVGAVEADFSLMEFLRDNYNVTRLVLTRPVIDLTIDENGLFGSGIEVATGKSAVVLAQASIVDGTIRLEDVRTGERFVATDLDGDLRLASFSGPFQFQGTAEYDAQRYSLRFNSALVDVDGNTRVTSFLQPVDGAFTLSTEGILSTGIAPKFDGSIVLRQAPPAAEAAAGIRGDLVFESKVQASTDRIVLSGYVLQPDENRSSARLTGAASIQLGDRRSFDAVISGGVFSLPPRDASEDATLLPFEFVRLLDELPAPLLPPMPGRIGVDLAEVGLRGFSLRQVRLDATTDGSSWEITQAIAHLPGDTEVRASGSLIANEGLPGFTGQVSIKSQRLDALAALWRKPGDDNPLFNMPGSLEGKVMLAGGALGLSGGVLTLEDTAHAVDLRLGFAEERRLDVTAHFADLGTAESAALGALLPEMPGAGFATSFPAGSFTLSAKSARVAGQDGTTLVAEGQWGETGLQFTRLSAGDIGGLGFDMALALQGTLADPLVSGSGVIRASNPAAPALVALHDRADTPAAWRDALALSLPGEVIFDLTPANSEGAQTLTLGGRLGAADLDITAQLSGGLNGALTQSLRVNGTLESRDPPALTRQLGFGDAEIFFDASDMMVSLNFEGVPGEELKSQITASAGEEYLSFSGNLLVADNAEIQGTGSIEGKLVDAAGLAQLAGARGLGLPMAEGRADLHFEGQRLARLTGIEGRSGEAGFSGELSLSRTGGSAMVAGAVALDSVDVTGLAAAVFGPAALIPGSGPWPDGPIDIGDTARSTRGTVAVTTPLVTVGGEPMMRDASFDLSWDETRTRLARFEAGIGNGQMTFDVSVCCSGPLADKTVAGRLTLDGVSLDEIAPPAVAEALGGVIDGGLRFEATGASFAAVAQLLAGEGNFTIADFTVDKLDPAVFATVAALDGVLEMDADALSIIIGQGLEQGAFKAPELAGAFTVAGGVARLANLIVEGDGASLAGGLNLTVETLGLDGSFAMTPLGFDDPNGLVDANTARIATRLSGTLPEPVNTLDLDIMVAALQVRANELEVDRLEVLRAEDAERQRAAAEERNRLIAEQRRVAAEEAARLAAEEEARRQEELRVQEEQRLLQQQQQAVPPVQAPAPSPQVAPTGPLDLNLPPINRQFPGGVIQPQF